MNNDFVGLKSAHYLKSDPGLVWVKDPEVSIGPDTPLDSMSILTPNVVRLPQGGLSMYYTGLGPGRRISASYGYILSAVSKDGLNWSKEPGIRIDVHGPNATYRVLCPDAIPLPDGRWTMDDGECILRQVQVIDRHRSSARYRQTDSNGNEKKGFG